MSHVGVVSLGLIGGSVALRLASQRVRVSAWNPSQDPLEQAARHGIEPAGSIAQLCAQEPDVLILANPLRAMPTVMAEVAAHVRGGTVVTDVGSVKAPIDRLARDAGLTDRFVGAHPMAGKELTGFAAADPGMLTGARWAVTPGADTPVHVFLRVVQLVTGPLSGVVHAVDPRMHDEAVALISHVPHVLATELLNLVARTPVRDLALSLAAGSFRDGTRVAHTDPRRTEAMVVENSAWVAPALRAVIRDLEGLVQQLEDNGSTGFFDVAQELRDAGPGRVPGAGSGGSAQAQERRIRLDLPHWWETLLAAAPAGSRIIGADEETRELILPG